MVVEALGLAITSTKDENQEIPIASHVDTITIDEGLLAVVEFFVLEYCKKHN